ncbi:hypothetical protein [Alloactinosynnema sp. L-07]|uniref:hypothetical protein n=1 Tax=Alloactinosynnema sp. L-07 TaxID=1653480 RepID=UPI00065EFF21|nr:hypothetical protein [Alloactinosynnema sp. L-07]CRK59315.1 hypothetical protein [Alloactinosynnema sp. L-07]
MANALGKIVNLAVCRAWTTGELLDPAEHTTFERCEFCVQILNDLRLVQGADHG